MRDSIRIVLASVILIVASVSSMHFAVTDSWYADSDTVRVEITTSVPDFEIVISGGSFTDDGTRIVFSSDVEGFAVITILLQDDGPKFKVESISGGLSVEDPSGSTVSEGSVLNTPFTLVLEGTMTLVRV